MGYRDGTKFNTLNTVSIPAEIDRSDEMVLVRFQYQVSIAYPTLPYPLPWWPPNLVALPTSNRTNQMTK
ncbi:Protein of unknown function [Pyronema omphalodes CBS 100304]|uniref:Uncharacterized protein n=1 Tax=Pyronema omphalodes (strain CBS 100304) TaxID=1076935 RepID=U4LH10_PYROM|nr:Protein of unknown function [Pyronema omphalodes CBS 100304]